MNRLFLSALTACTILAGSAVALAQMPASQAQSSPRGHAFFEAVDANHDGVVTRAEATAAAEKRFAELDTNHDGKISQAERDAKRQAERARRTAERFAALDTDKNGQLSPQEFGAPREGGPGMGKGDSGGWRHGRWGHGGWGQGGWGRGPQGDVTKTDFMAPMLRHFDMLDSNDDGKITAEERDAAMARFGHGRDDHGPGGRGADADRPRS